MPGPAAGALRTTEVIDGQTIVNLPLFTLNPALVVSGYWTSALPAGLLQLDRDPGQRHGSAGLARAGRIGHGARSTTPGCSSPGTSPRRSFEFKLADLHPERHDQPSIGAACESSLQPPGISTAAWTAIYTGLTTQIGDTCGGYVTDARRRGDLPRPARRGCDRRQPALGVRDDAGRRAVARARAGQRDRPRRRRPRPGRRSISAAVYAEPISSRDTLGPARLRLDRQLAVFAVASPPTAP